MAVVSDFTVDVVEGIAPLTVNFTDISTGSPDRWLWDFGDGYFSTDQHPSHIYRGKWNTVIGDFSIVDENGDPHTYTVTLTALKENWDLAHGNTWENYSSIGVISDPFYNYASFANALAAFETTLPYTDWTVTNGTPNFGSYHGESLSDTWSFRYEYFDRTCFNLSAYPQDECLAYMEMRLSPSHDTGDIKKHYENGKSEAIKVGRWLGGEFVEGSEVRFRLNYDQVPFDSSDFPVYNLEEFIGDTADAVMRTVDCYEFASALRDPLVYGASGTNAAGFSSNPYYPFWQFYRAATSADKDIETKNNLITVGESLIERPAILYSGIKEAYFSDGWENDKHFFVEQSKAYPCVIEFVDIYCDTTNE